METHLRRHFLRFLISYHLISSSNAEPIFGVDMNFAVLGSFNFAFLSLITNRSSTNFDEKYICTSTLISERFVMTIAECIQNLPLEDLEVTFGYVDKEEDENKISGKQRSGVYPAKTTITFSEWSEKRGWPTNIPPYNDIALIELHEYVTFKPAVISPRNHDQGIGSTVLMQGWRKIKSKLDIIQPDLPHQAPMKIISNTACESRIKKFTKSYKKFKISDNVFCMSGASLAVALHSDIGGPVLNLAKQVIGITVKRVPSTTSYWLDKGNVNLALRLSDYRGFINDVASSGMGSMQKKFRELNLN
ncbi:hypothetical protein QAD02_016767 [Eretmocerus hayati]|uniref:Uncharacterized protein n=1 Tax=Eretmocerus hayati TaxID=131215 RepID=A0ACC2PBI8_9HYME|nr:hypothetical protein QAD02_016767 [Eretmocerus hayati]